MISAAQSATAAVAARILARSRLLAMYTEVPGQITRTFLSSAMEEVHQEMWAWFEALGMEVKVDRAGNIRCLYRSRSGDDSPRLLIASHLDTVPNAGPYDGVLGILLGLALVEMLAGRRYSYAIEVIGFSDEEGVRFGVPFLGSRALLGDLDGPDLDTLDSRGVSMRTALQMFGDAHPGAVDPLLDTSAAAYLEFHIEQGPLLASRGLPLGVVESIACQSRSRLVFRGKAGHAGTMPMQGRRDALVAAAEWIFRSEALASAFADLRATVGKITVRDGAGNVIPGEVECSLDVRHTKEEMVRAAVKAMHDLAGSITTARGVALSWHEHYMHPPVEFDGTMAALASRAAIRAGYEPLRMNSFAGHDAMPVAARLPAVMFFLRSPNGLSHCPEETVLESDIAAALEVGMAFLCEFETFFWAPRHLPPSK